MYMYADYCNYISIYFPCNERLLTLSGWINSAKSYMESCVRVIVLESDTSLNGLNIFLSADPT